MAINFLKYSRAYCVVCIILTVASLALLAVFGLNLGIDLEGGTVLEAEFAIRPSNPLIEEKLAPLNLGEIVLQPKADNGLIIRMKQIGPTVHQQILTMLNELNPVKETQFETIGPVIGKEIREKTNLLIAVSLIALLLYITIAFRKVSWPVPGWQYGLVSVVILCFDVLVTIGVLVLLGEFKDVQFNIPIITALLTILGYTINDKVIVFDRLRENLLKNRNTDFKSVVNISLNQTLIRSLSTGFCALLVLFFIFFLGGDTLKYFSLTLIIGIVVGTFSSLFLATPLLTGFLYLKERKFRKRI